MFGFDPIDLGDPSPYGPLSYYGHLAIGLLCLVSAAIALAVRKGSARHILAGRVFFGTTLLVCATAAAMMMSNFIPPLFLAAITATYAVTTGWLALRKGGTEIRMAEYALCLVEIVGIVIYLKIAIGAALAGIVPLPGVLMLTIIPAILIVGDINWFVRPKQRANLRVRRHLSRMIWASVVILRAPLVELAAAGIPIPPPLFIFGPLVIALPLIWYFSQRIPNRLQPPAATG